MIQIPDIHVMGASEYQTGIQIVYLLDAWFQVEWWSE